MRQSESIAKLAAALVAAQAEMKSIAKDSANPFFNSRYASLDTIVETVRPILGNHQLAIVQGTTTPHTDGEGVLRTITLETMLIHSSGEWICNAVVMPVGTAKDKEKRDIGPTAQTAGSSVTYGRRYGIGALLSITTDEDDDGNAASQGKAKASRPAPTTNSAPPLSASDFHNFLMPMGKSKGKMLKDLDTKDLESAIDWAAEKGKFEEFQAAGEKELESRKAESLDFDGVSA